MIESLADDVAIIIVSIDEISDFGERAGIGIGIKPACAAEVIIAVRVSYSGIVVGPGNYVTACGPAMRWLPFRGRGDSTAERFGFS